jgi:hypothetical protein
MPNRIAVRACTALPDSHLVLDANVLGMVRNEDASVSVYCVDHHDEFDRATRRAILALGVIPLQM